VDVGFIVQGGIAQPSGDAERHRSGLGLRQRLLCAGASVFYPRRRSRSGSLPSLAGKRIAIGREGSGRARPRRNAPQSERHRAGGTSKARRLEGKAAQERW